jgi:hypothetical protein
MKQKTNTVEVWRGPSEITGEPIVVLLTMRSKNRKTGDMAQTTILTQASPPHEAQASGDDAAVCGSCPLRPSTAAAGAPRCYVITWRQPGAVYRAWRAGNVPRMSLSEASDRVAELGGGLRLGAYGDPGAVPVAVWRDLTPRDHTGYTHQWRVRPALRRYAMASVGSVAEAKEAQRAGWRTYRVDSDHVGPTRSEIACPHDRTGVQCRDCGLCSGSSRLNPTTKSIVIKPI